jgi:ribosomal protein L2
MKEALVISDQDNVATALQHLEPGARLEFGALVVVVAERVPPGHKVALRAIPAGSAVIKYGSPIGMASSDIPAGAHVHIHNVESNRGRGDLDAPTIGPQPRLAEPPDEATPRADGLSARMPGK